MKKKKIWRPIAMGMAATLLVALPVYAEETNPDSTKPTEKVTDTLLPTEPVTRQDSTQDNIKIASAEEVNAYVGQTVTKITIDGDKHGNHDAIMDALKVKPGMEFTKDGIAADCMQSINLAGSTISCRNITKCLKACRLPIM